MQHVLSLKSNVFVEFRQTTLNFDAIADKNRFFDEKTTSSKKNGLKSSFSTENEPKKHS